VRVAGRAMAEARVHDAGALERTRGGVEPDAQRCLFPGEVPSASRGDAAGQGYRRLREARDDQRDETFARRAREPFEREDADADESLDHVVGLPPGPRIRVEVHLERGVDLAVRIPRGR
jgi:hypothetical protein